MKIRERNDYEEIISHFQVHGGDWTIERCGSGHINETLRVSSGRDMGGETGAGQEYILQQMNTEVFRNPEGLIRNIVGITSFLRKKIIARGGDPVRETLTLIGTVDGKYFYRSPEGECWRMYLFVGGASCYDAVEKPEDFYQAGKAFGNFQKLLSDYPVEELSETIPDFHRTPARFEAFCRAVDEDVCGRRDMVLPEIQFLMDRKDEMGAVQKLLDSGELPPRVTHNDTKLNNILIDDRTGEALCILDLDTVMPGTPVFDYGDAIRFGANTAAEDETDLRKVSLSLELLEAYTKGFLEGCGDCLTDLEKRMLPMGAKLMTLECGMRFLTDFLQGDIYYRIHRENHNLDRARTQLALVCDMEQKWSEMEKIV